MQAVEVPPQQIDAYAESAGSDVIAELRQLAERLDGLRVLHVNATPDGGGVAEILRSAVPLLNGLGLVAMWQTMEAELPFFATTKTIHNALQGANCNLSADDQATYVDGQLRNADRLVRDVDVVVIHDPQPLGLLQAAGKGTQRWIWRLHVDSSQPNPAVWSLLQPYVNDYDAAVFTMEKFVPQGVPSAKVRISPPAIDPLSPKNRSLPCAQALAILVRLGIDPARPLVAQVARLDPWKDPKGVIDAYRIARRKVPGLQLALLGVVSAQDDPEAVGIAEEVRSYANGDPDIHLFVDPEQIGMEEVAAVQQVAQVILQKSLREGFGLSVAEALWKVTPVIGGRTGGIPLQLADGAGGFLVETIEEAADYICWLLDHPPEARHMAALGRDRVRAQFLITRLIADELRFYAEVMGLRPLSAAAAD